MKDAPRLDPPTPESDRKNARAWLRFVERNLKEDAIKAAGGTAPAAEEGPREPGRVAAANRNEAVT